jgi:hypothetical protein
MRKLNRPSHRLRDFCLYIVLSIAIVALVALLAVHQAKTGQRPDVAFRWVAFALNTAFVFGYSLRGARTWLKQTEIVGDIGDSSPAARDHGSIGSFTL